MVFAACLGVLRRPARVRPYGAARRRAVDRFTRPLLFIPAISTFSRQTEKKQKQRPLYKISKEHADVPRPRHLMGINYACLRARRRHKALFKINTASGCVRREAGNAELRPSLPPSLPDQRPRRAGLKLASAFQRAADQHGPPEFGSHGGKRRRKKKKKPCGRSLTLGATARNEPAEACEVILITDAAELDVPWLASAPRGGLAGGRAR